MNGAVRIHGFNFAYLAADSVIFVGVNRRLAVAVGNGFFFFPSVIAVLVLSNVVENAVHVVIYSYYSAVSVIIILVCTAWLVLFIGCEIIFHSGKHTVIIPPQLYEVGYFTVAVYGFCFCQTVIPVVCVVVPIKAYQQSVWAITVIAQPGRIVHKGIRRAVLDGASLLIKGVFVDFPRVSAVKPTVIVFVFFIKGGKPFKQLFGVNIVFLLFKQIVRLLVFSLVYKGIYIFISFGNSNVFRRFGLVIKNFGQAFFRLAFLGFALFGLALLGLAFLGLAFFRFAFLRLTLFRFARFRNTVGLIIILGDGVFFRSMVRNLRVGL